MFRFESPYFLYLLIIVPVLIVIFIISEYVKTKRIKKFGDPELMKSLMPNATRYRPAIKFSIVCLAMIFMILLIARPQFGTKTETVTKKGIEVVIALDISNSMMAQDVLPSRLDKSKNIISRLVDNFDNNKIGLVLFAGDAYTQLPITSDYVSAKMFLNNISPSLISRQGTAIGAALNLAMNSFTPQQGVGKSIIVITDGENHEGGVMEAVKAASDKGIQVNVLGVGSVDGAPIPVSSGSDYKKDNSGNIVVTKLNEQMCQDIARQGNGIYARVDNTNSAFRALEKQLDTLSKADIDTKVFSQYNEQFIPLAWIVLVLLVLEALIMNKKNPLFRNVKLFS
ncbi:MAG TPA: VWA domain-containing protein [Candidatus Avibacteroides excrementipullorum]|jgi:Ca-activated chloride channel family protein|nr:VWA domain-containing protein [Candidatus Avibacteroides excrementipullorum]